MKFLRAIITVLSMFTRAILGALTVAVIFWWLHSLESIAEKAPAFNALKQLDLTLQQGSEVYLGRAELLQPGGARAAELRHVRLRATEDGRLLISRVAELRNLNIEFGGKTEEGSSEQYEISRLPGAVTRLSAGSQFLDIEVLEDGGVAFSIEDGPGTKTSAVVYDDGAETLVNGTPADGCYEQGKIAWVSMLAGRFSNKASLSLSNFLEERGLSFLFQRRGKLTVAVLGGNVNCSMHNYALLAMPRANQELEFAVRKNLSDGRLFVSLHREADLVPISYETWIDGQNARKHFGRTGIEFPVASLTPLTAHPVTKFTAGRTRYSIEAKAAEDGLWQVRIQPDRRVSLFDDSICSQPLSSATNTLSPEDCPPSLQSSPNILPTNAKLEVTKEVLPPALDRMFVPTTHGLSSVEALARAAAICIALLIVLAVPGASRWRSNGSTGRGILLAFAGAGTLVLCMLPDLISIGEQFVAIPMASRWMYYALGALWCCATLVITLERSRGHLLSAFWLVLTAIIAIGSISMFSMSLEGPNTDWERFFIKHKLVVLDILPLFVITLTIVSPTALKLRIGNDFAGRPSFFSPIFWLLSIVLALFAAWFLLGNQTGLGGSIQPVEAGKFTIVVLLGASLAQWLIRARLLAQPWFGLTLIAIVLSALFIVALLFVPAVKSDYSPLIIITSATAITSVIGLMVIGARIREEELDDIRGIKRIPLSYVPEIRDIRISPLQLLLLSGSLGLVIAGQAIYSSPQFQEQLAVVLDTPAISISVAIVLAYLAYKLVQSMFIARSVFIMIFGLPLALIGTWAYHNNETAILAIAVGILTVSTLAIAIGGRINSTLARIAIGMPVIAVILAIGFRDLPTKLALGVDKWSWFSDSDTQIEELEKTIGNGRRLPVERLMSWADLRYDRFGNGEADRPLVLRDVNFHVLRSRATLAHASCGLSPELTNAPFGIGLAVNWIGYAASKSLGLSCAEGFTEPSEKLSCTPSTLKGPVRAHCVPVVQSDFAATYITARFGNTAAALLVALQGIFVLLVFSLYLRLQSRRSRDPVETGADQALACIALGVGMLFLVQWILAWSNSFGLLPVMGQPMTWLSAGTSHHLFMAIPAALVLLVATRLAAMKTPVLTNRVPPRRRG